MYIKGITNILNIAGRTADIFNICNIRMSKILFFAVVFSAVVFFDVPLVFADTSSTPVGVSATVPAICGNGVKEGSEQCDDDNVSNGDGCSSSCQMETATGPAAPAPSPSPAPATPPATEPPPPATPPPAESPDATESPAAESPSEPPSGEPSSPPADTGSPSGETTGGTDSGGGDSGAPGSSESGESSPPASSGGGETGSSSGVASPGAAEIIGSAIGSAFQSAGGGISTFVGAAAQNISQSISEAIVPEATVVQNIRNVAEALGKSVADETRVAAREVKEAAKKAAQKSVEVAKSPEVQKANKEVVAPTVATVSVVTVAPSLWSIIFPLLRFLFLQPILYVGHRKRETWGRVYNALSRLPVDLAMVRLLDAEKGTVLQSRVTDAKGRYLFLVEPGEYRLEVAKRGLSFPSQILKEATSDGRMLDIYHGELIRADEDGVAITPNIPLDPIEAQAMPRRIGWESPLRMIQHAVSLFGIAMTLVSFAVSPTWYIASFLAVHAALYIIFMRYVRPPKPKGWGIVYDETTKEPVGRAVARLFTKEYNKLVSSQITDAMGRYAFLAGPNDYYVTVEKPGYAIGRAEDLTLTDAERGFIKKDIALAKNSGSAPPALRQPQATPTIGAA